MMKNLIFIKLSVILFLLILEVKGAKKKATNNVDDENITINDGPENSVLAESAYCNQYVGSKIYLDATKLKQLDANQYISEIFSKNKEITVNSKLDYFIRYSLISKGLCFYEPSEVKELNKFPKFPHRPENGQPYEEIFRYEKTVNCFYYYSQYVHEESRAELNKHRIALNHLNLYMQSLYFFIYDEKLCPYPKEHMKTPFEDKDEVTRNTLIYNSKVTYVIDLNNFYTQLYEQYRIDSNGNMNNYETQLELDTNNYELTNCGYPTEEQKNEYCKTNSDICCPLRHNQNIITLELNKSAVYYGVGVASALIIAGSFFSSKIIKEIQMQENIKKSILNQEKEYQEINKINLQNAYNEGFDPKIQQFNSNSRNLNGTLRNPGRNVGTLPHTDTTLGLNSNSGLTMGGNSLMSLGSSGMTLNSGGSMGRYPPNSFNVTEEYKSSDARDLSLKRGMIVQLIQKFEGGWVMVKDIQTNRQGYAPEYCLALCPYPKGDMKNTHEDETDENICNTRIYNDRVEYINNLNAFYEMLNKTYSDEHPMDLREYETQLELDTRNLELTFCGYPTEAQKKEYCKNNPDDVCCPLKQFQTPYTFEFNKLSAYYGVAVSSALVIVGSFFSARIIKEIQMQETLKKSLFNQGREYQEINNQNLQNAYKEGFDPKIQQFNSNSRNLNGTLRNPGRNVGTLPHTETTLGYSSNSRLTLGNSSGLSLGSSGATLRSGGGSMGRYPPNSFNVIEDYQTSDARDISLKRGMVVQLIQKFDGGWVMVKDIQTNRQGYAPEYCLGNKM
ncbi:hypothetical protein PIROE2DRAFT_69973 [Piromyces sp. E2]|nr:hypothetical protein PIROE2DRAFT_69973 [Piromyces sp. E2]|eukprot:OUM58302.1 hypothetical protein PIROE2DRAFT_69973 [Piromyces sp. E2]